MFQLAAFMTFYIWPPPTHVGLIIIFLAIGIRWENMCIVVFAPSVVLDYDTILFIIK